MIVMLNRRNFLKTVPLAGMAGAVNPGSIWRQAGGTVQSPAAGTDRAYWSSLLSRIATPVLLNLSKGQLK